MQTIDEKQPGTVKRRNSAENIGKKKRKRAANSATTEVPTGERIQIEYTRETFELLGKLPKVSADCYRPEDDDL